MSSPRKRKGKTYQITGGNYSHSMFSKAELISQAYFHPRGLTPQELEALQYGNPDSLLQLKKSGPAENTRSKRQLK